MKYLIFALFLVSTSAFATDGWWCYARAPSGDKVLKSALTLECAKNEARRACNQAYGPGCEVTQCYEKSPYRFACIAGMETETRIGAFRTYSNNIEAARSVAMSNCNAHHGNLCQSICYKNFQPTEVVNE